VTTVRSRLALVALFVGVFMFPASASAHTDLDFTLPTNGASVGEPVSEITVGFTEPVTLVGQGFEVLDPQGNVIVPFAVTDDDQVFRLQLDPPVGGGEVGVAYEVRSADDHIVSGSFSFTVSVPAPTSTTTPATTAATTTPPPSTSSPAETTAAPTTTDAATTDAATTDVTTTLAATSTTGVETTTTDVPDGDDGGSGSTWIILAIAGVVVIGASAFLLFRPRPS
jgi:copper transport protein